MNVAEVMKKVQNGEGLTLSEVKFYQQRVKPQVHTYGKYGNLAKIYLEEHCFGKMIALAGELPEYLHGVDQAAAELYEAMYAKLSTSEQYQKTGDYLSDLQKETEMQRLIEEEILNEIVYVA